MKHLVYFVESNTTKLKVFKTKKRTKEFLENFNRWYGKNDGAN